jgi:hypothetical protein
MHDTVGVQHVDESNNGAMEFRKIEGRRDPVMFT